MSKFKIKIITTYSYASESNLAKGTEKATNEWLEENKDIKIISLSHTLIHRQTDIEKECFTLLTTIFFEDDE